MTEATAAPGAVEAMIEELLFGTRITRIPPIFTEKRKIPKKFVFVRAIRQIHELKKQSLRDDPLIIPPSFSCQTR